VTLHGLGHVMLTKQTKDYSEVQICAYEGANFAFSGIGNGNNKNIVSHICSRSFTAISVFTTVSDC